MSSETLQSYQQLETMPCCDTALRRRHRTPIPWPSCGLRPLLDPTAVACTVGTARHHRPFHHTALRGRTRLRSAPSTRRARTRGRTHQAHQVWATGHTDSTQRHPCTLLLEGTCSRSHRITGTILPLRPIPSRLRPDTRSTTRQTTTAPRLLALMPAQRLRRPRHSQICTRPRPRRRQQCLALWPRTTPQAVVAPTLVAASAAICQVSQHGPGIGAYRQPTSVEHQG